jgi:hypothetical protein
VAVLAALNVTAPGGNANWSNNFQYSSNNDSNSSTGYYNSSTSTAEENYSSGTGYTFIYNSWGNWAPKFANDKLLFAFNALLGTSSTNGSIFGNVDPSQPGTTWFGAGAYAKYQFNDWFSLCSRGEYLGGNNPEKIYNTNQPNTDTLSLWEYTITAGFNVIDNLLIRAEYRLDWGNSSVINNNGGSEITSTSSGPAHYAGAEVVYSF